MFGISGFELFLIVVFALLIFGPDKLPEFGRKAGRFMREFKRIQESMESNIRAELYRTEGSSPPTPASPSPAAAAALDDEDEEEEEE